MECFLHGDKVYALDTSDQAALDNLSKLAWEEAKVTGTANGDTISVKSDAFDFNQVFVTVWGLVWSLKPESYPICSIFPPHFTVPFFSFMR